MMHDIHGQGCRGGGMPGALPLPISTPGNHAHPSSMATSASLHWGRLVIESEVIRTPFPSFRGPHTSSSSTVQRDATLS